MVSLQEALQEAEEAEDVALVREREIRDVESQVGRLATGGSLTAQIQAGSAPEFTRRRRAAKKTKRQTLEQTAKARKEVGLFREQISSRRAEVQKTISEAAFVKKAIDQGTPLIGIPRRLRQRIQQGRQAQQAGQARLKQKQATVGISTFEGEGLVPIGGNEIFFPQSVPDISSVGISTTSGAGIVLGQDILVSQQSIEPDTLARFRIGDISPTTTTTRDTPTTTFDLLPPPRAEILRQDKKEPGPIGDFTLRLLKESGITGPRLFGAPRGREAPPILGLAAIGAQEISQFISQPDFGVVGRRPKTFVDIFTPKLTSTEQQFRTDITSLLGKTTAKLIPQTAESIALTGATIAVFPTLSPFLKTIGFGGFTALETKAFLEAETLPGKIAAGIGGGLALTGSAFELAPFAKGLIAKRATTTPFGEKVFTGIKTGKQQAQLDITGLSKEFRISGSIKGLDKIDVALIPPGGQKQFFGERFGPKFGGDIGETIKLGELGIPFRQEPFLPKLSKSDLSILKSLGPGDEIVTGSLARNVLLERQRPFKDIDIISKDVLGTTERILGSATGLEAIRKPKAVTIREIRTGRELADIVSLDIGEGGFISNFPTTEVGGIKFADPRSILGGKLTSLSGTTVGPVARKSTLDISQITGGKIDLGGPTIKGAFGFTFEEQLALSGKRANIGIAAIDFAKSLIGKVSLQKPLFGTPSKIGDPFLIRESRLGLKSSFFKAPDPSAELRFQFGGGKSQALIIRDVTIETGSVISPKALKALARRADLGDERAISNILKATEQFKTAGIDSFAPSAQRRGELEVVKFGGELDVLGKLGSLRVRGQAVDLFELGISGKPPKGNGFDFSKGLNKILKESRQKGFENLPRIKQRDLLGGIRRESGFDITRALGEVNIVSPSGLGSFGLGAQRLRPSSGRRTGGFGRGGFGAFTRRSLGLEPTRRGFVDRDPFRGLISQPTRRSQPVTRRPSAEFIDPRRGIPDFTIDFPGFTRPPSKPKLNGGRKKTKRIQKRRRSLDFPISVSFSAVATESFGRFPKVKIKGLGLTPRQIRFQPLRRAPKRATLGGIRARRRKRR